MDLKFYIATAATRNAKFWKNAPITWQAFKERCAQVHRTAETMAEYEAFNRTKEGKLKRAEIKDTKGGFVGGYLEGGRRKREAVTYREMVCLDADDADPGVWQRFLQLNLVGLVYSTHSHTPKTPRLRICIPINRPVNAAEYEPIARRITGYLGIDQFDPTTYEMQRLMYWPTVPADAPYWFAAHDAPGSFVLNADAVLASYRNWRDVSEWPIGKIEQEIYRGEISRQQDPTIKEGIVGSVCRTYTIPEAIDAFLPTIYCESDVENRYSYIPGEGTAGLRIYDDGLFAFSHHSTDPAYGRHCWNAFDLVRIHKFRHLDENAKPDTATSKLPSYEAMCEFAAKDPNIRATMAAEKLASLDADFYGFKPDMTGILPAALQLEINPAGQLQPVYDAAAFLPENGQVVEDYTVVDQPGPDANNWLAQMEFDRRGMFTTCVENFELILLNDPNLKGKFKYNLLAFRMEVLAALPWNPNPGRRFWDDDDWSGLRTYVQKHPYRLDRSPKLEDAYGSVKPLISYHPVRDYLNTLLWDGHPRIDTLFIDYLGAEDSQYTRAVTRKSLIACVARVFSPGIKVDNLVSLLGEEGKGKSEILRRLGGKWFTDNFSFHMLSNGSSKAQEAIQGAWIVEIAEMAGLKKAEVESAKGFISTQEDDFRGAYGREKSFKPRQCVFFGTSNNLTPLQSSNGNRRFWPVEIAVQPVKYDLFAHFDEGQRAQVWAEALEYWRAGEGLYIGKEVEALAKIKQRQHEEKDERREEVIRYLNMLLPDNWDNMLLMERRTYILNYANLTGKNKGTNIRMRVSAAEVWNELLEGDLKTMTNLNTRPLHAILNNIEDWERAKSKTIFKFYGNQTVYRRKINTDIAEYN